MEDLLFGSADERYGSAEAAQVPGVKGIYVCIDFLRYCYEKILDLL